MYYDCQSWKHGSPKIMMTIGDHNTNIYNAWCNIMESVDSICRNNSDNIM